MTPEEEKQRQEQLKFGSQALKEQAVQRLVPDATTMYERSRQGLPNYRTIGTEVMRLSPVRQFNTDGLVSKFRETSEYPTFSATVDRPDLSPTEQRRLDKIKTIDYQLQQYQDKLLRENPEYMSALTGQDNENHRFGFLSQAWDETKRWYNIAEMGTRTWYMKETLTNNQRTLGEKFLHNFDPTIGLLRFGGSLLQDIGRAAMGIFIAGPAQSVINLNRMRKGEEPIDITWQSDSWWYKLLMGREVERDYFGRVISEKPIPIESITARQKRYEEAMLKWQDKDGYGKDTIYGKAWPIFASRFGAAGMFMLELDFSFLPIKGVSAAVETASIAQKTSRKMLGAFIDVAEKSGTKWTEALEKEAMLVARQALRAKNSLQAQRVVNSFIKRIVPEGSVGAKIVDDIEAGIQYEIDSTRAVLDNMAAASPTYDDFLGRVSSAIVKERSLQRKAIADTLEKVTTDPAFIGAQQRMMDIYREFGTGLTDADLYAAKLRPDTPENIAKEFTKLRDEAQNIIDNYVTPLGDQLAAVSDNIPLGQGAFDITKTLLNDSEKTLDNFLKDVYDGVQGRKGAVQEAAQRGALSGAKDDTIMDALDMLQRDITAFRTRGGRSTAAEKMSDYLYAEAVARGVLARQFFEDAMRPIGKVAKEAAPKAKAKPAASRINDKQFKAAGKITYGDTLLTAAEDAAKYDSFEGFVKNSEEVVYQGETPLSFIRDKNLSDAIVQMDNNPPVVLSMKQPLRITAAEPGSGMWAYVQMMGLPLPAAREISPEMAQQILERAKNFGFDGVIFTRPATADMAATTGRIVIRKDQVIPAESFWDTIQGGVKKYGDAVAVLSKRKNNPESMLEKLPKATGLKAIENAFAKFAEVPRGVAARLTQDLHGAMVNHFVMTGEKTVQNSDLVQLVESMNKYRDNIPFNGPASEKAIYDNLSIGTNSKFELTVGVTKENGLFNTPVQKAADMRKLYDNVVSAFEKDAQKKIKDYADVKIPGGVTDAEFAAKGEGHRAFLDTLHERVMEGVFLPEDALLVRTALADTDDTLMKRIPLLSRSKGWSQPYGRTTSVVNRQGTRRWVDKITLRRGLAYTSINPRSWKMGGEITNRAIWEQQSAAQVFFHEFGHIGHNALLTDGQRKAVKKIYQSFNDRELAELFGMESFLRAGTFRHVIGNADEFFSEAFSQYVLKNNLVHKELEPLFTRITNVLRDAMAALFGKRSNTVTGKLDALNPLFEQILRGESLSKEGYRTVRDPGVPDDVIRMVTQDLDQKFPDWRIGKPAGTQWKDLTKAEQAKFEKERADWVDKYSEIMDSYGSRNAPAGDVESSYRLRKVLERLKEKSDRLKLEGKEMKRRIPRTPITGDSREFMNKRPLMSRQTAEEARKLLNTMPRGKGIPKELRAKAMEPPKGPPSKSPYERPNFEDPAPNMLDAKVPKQIADMDPFDPKLVDKLDPQNVFGKNTKVPANLRQGQEKLQKTIRTMQKRWEQERERTTKAIENLKTSRDDIVRLVKQHFKDQEEIRKGFSDVLKVRRKALTEIFETGFSRAQEAELGRLALKLKSQKSLKTALNRMEEMFEEQLRKAATKKIGEITKNVDVGTDRIPVKWQERIADEIGPQGIRLKGFKEAYEARLKALQKWIEESEAKYLKELEVNPNAAPPEHTKYDFVSPKTLSMLHALELLAKKPASEFTTVELVKLAKRIDELYDEGLAAKMVIDGGKTKKITRLVPKLVGGKPVFDPQTGNQVFEKFVVQKGGEYVPGIKELRAQNTLEQIRDWKAQGLVKNIDSGSIVGRKFGDVQKDRSVYGQTEQWLKDAAEGDTARWGVLNYLSADRVFALMDNLVFQGPMYKLIRKPLNEAIATGEGEARKKLIAYKDFEDSLAKKYGSELSDANYERIAIHAYWKQNATGKMLKSGIPQADIDAAKTLTAHEREVYEYMREELDKMWPQVDETMRNVYGTRINKIDNYFPIQNNLLDSRKVHEVLLDEFTVRKRAVQKNFTKERYTITKGLEMRINARDIFTKHMRDTNYFVHVDPELDRLTRFVRTDDFTALMGRNFRRFMENWVDIIARRGTPQNYQYNWWDVLHRRLGSATLGFNPSPILKQPLAIFAAMGHVPTLGLDGFYLMRRYGLKDAIGKVSAEQFLRAADDPVFAEYSVARKIEKWQQWGYGGIKWADTETSRAVWLAAYVKKLKEKGLKFNPENFKNKIGIDNEALDYADYVVRTTQGSGKFQDMPLMLSNRQRKLWKTLFQFQTFVLGQSQVVAFDAFYRGLRVLAQARKGQNVVKVRDAAGKLLVIPVSVGTGVVIEDKLSAEMEGWWGSDDTKQYLEDRDLSAIYSDMAGTMFPPYGLIQNIYGANTNNLGIPLVDKIYATGRALYGFNNKQDAEAVIKDAERVFENMISLGVGLPGTTFAGKVLRGKWGIEGSMEKPYEQLKNAVKAGDKAEVSMLLQEFRAKGLDPDEITQKALDSIKSDEASDRADTVKRIANLIENAEGPDEVAEIRALIAELTRKGEFTDEMAKEIVSELKSRQRTESLGEFKFNQ